MDGPPLQYEPPFAILDLHRGGFQVRCCLPCLIGAQKHLQRTVPAAYDHHKHGERQCGSDRHTEQDPRNSAAGGGARKVMAIRNPVTRYIHEWPSSRCFSPAFKDYIQALVRAFYRVCDIDDAKRCLHL